MLTVSMKDTKNMIIHEFKKYHAINLSDIDVNFIIDVCGPMYVRP